jgi:hypothetical protein
MKWRYIIALEKIKSGKKEVTSSFSELIGNLIES